MDEGSESGEDELRAAKNLVNIINMYTGEIARAIQKAEDERVENMLGNMEAEE
jgi:hypothetical protein